MEPKEFYTQIEDYLSGTLSQEERQSFENAMQQDAALNEEVKANQIAFDALELLVEDNISLQLKNLQKERYSQKKVRRIGRMPLAIAASVLVLIVAGFGFFMNNQYSNESLAMNHFEVFDSGGVRGDDDMNAFQAGDYRTAIEGFKNVAPTADNYNDAQFFLGQSYFMIGDYDNALQTLNNLNLDPQHRYINAKNWYLALSLLAKDDEAGATTILQQFVTDKTPRYSKNAQAILDDLNSFWRF